MYKGGGHMVNSPNYPDTDRNRDKSKYNFQFLGNFTIMTTKVIEEDDGFMIDYRYTREKKNPKSR